MIWRVHLPPPIMLAANHNDVRPRSLQSAPQMSSIDPDLIAGEVLAKFRSLPNRRKPKIRDNGAHEWVPLSGIVAEHDGRLECLAVA